MTTCKGLSEEFRRMGPYHLASLDLPPAELVGLNDMRD